MPSVPERHRRSSATATELPPAVDPRRRSPAHPPEAAHTPADKVRIRFRKSGTLRLLSHHDLMRTFERMLRRASLPFHRSQGFHPKPRLIFALSLPLGVVGREEVVELELDAAVAPEEVHARLARQTSARSGHLSVRRIDPQDHRAGAPAVLRAAAYRRIVCRT